LPRFTVARIRKRGGKGALTGVELTPAE